MSIATKSKGVPPPPKWVIDLNNGLPPKAKNASAIPNPPGFGATQVVSSKQVSYAP